MQDLFLILMRGVQQYLLYLQSPLLMNIQDHPDSVQLTHLKQKSINVLNCSLIYVDFKSLEFTKPLFFFSCVCLAVPDNITTPVLDIGCPLVPSIIPLA